MKKKENKEKMKKKRKREKGKLKRKRKMRMSLSSSANLMHSPSVSFDSERGLTRYRGDDLPLPYKIRTLSNFRLARRNPCPHMQNGHASVSPERHNFTCPHVDDARIVLCENDVVLRFLQTVDTDERAGHCSDLEHTLLRDT